jgi:membrane-associated phospholipid phosphatase
MLFNFRLNTLKKLSICLSFFLCLFSSKAQLSYQYWPKKDLPVLGASALVLGGSLYFQEKVPALSQAQIGALNAQNINKFDRYACTQWNTGIARGSDLLAIGSVFLPAYFAINKKTRSNFLPIANVSIQSLFLSQAIANLAKFSKRNRPYLYNPDVDMQYKLKSDSRMSFFSAHTTTVSSTCFSFAFAHSTYFKDSKANPYIWSTAIVLPAIEGYLRVKAGKHYPSDVIVGYLAGLGSAWLIHQLHLKQ